jgi:NH3-dependent NAD+ synthetase
MKAILEYTLPEETAELQQALDGGRWEMAMFELDQHLRGIVKYGDDEVAANHAQAIRDKLHEILSDNALVFSA